MLPIICFNCNEVGHMAIRCTKKKNYKGGDKYKNRREDNNKDYKDEGKKSCYIAEEKIRDDSDEHDDKVVNVAMKEKSNEDEVAALVTL